MKIFRIRIDIYRYYTYGFDNLEDYMINCLDEKFEHLELKHNKIFDDENGRYYYVFDDDAEIDEYQIDDWMQDDFSTYINNELDLNDYFELMRQYLSYIDFQLDISFYDMMSDVYRYVEIYATELEEDAEEVKELLCSMA